MDSIFSMVGQYGKCAPSFLKVLPKQTLSETQNEVKKPAPIPDPTGSRFSRRVRGMNDGVLYDPSVLDLVERSKSGFRVQKNSYASESKSPSKNGEDGNHDDTNDQQTTDQDGGEAVETNNDVVMEEEKQNTNQNDEKEVEMGENSNDCDPVNQVKRNLEFTKNGEGMITMILDKGYY